MDDSSWVAANPAPHIVDRACTGAAFQMCLVRLSFSTSSDVSNMIDIMFVFIMLVLLNHITTYGWRQYLIRTSLATYA